MYSLEPVESANWTTIVHGWKDDVVPVEQSIEFARRYGCALHILDSDHRLQDEVRFLKYLFEYFLISLDLPPDVACLYRAYRLDVQRLMAK